VQVGQRILLQLTAGIGCNSSVTNNIQQQNKQGILIYKLSSGYGETEYYFFNCTKRINVGRNLLTLVNFMRIPFIVVALFVTTAAVAQLEISTGLAVNKQDAVGFPIHVGYDFKVSNRFYTKSQIGYKYLHRYNDFVGATLNVSIWDIHQTLSYEVIKKRKYILKPNLGINYRFYHWKGKLDPPYNVVPQRAWVIGVREGHFVLNSYDNGFSNEYQVSNPGFSIQLQNQFRITDKVWLQITPFMEPDYDRSQNTGGCYIGIILK